MRFAQLAAIVDNSYSDTLVQSEATLVFEGAQGVLLDRHFGFVPYITQSTTTFANALGFLADHGFGGKIIKLGLVRTYATRHGPGPFISEDAELTRAMPDHHNKNNAWQGRFRVGNFDLVATRYALAVAGKADFLAVTHVDRLAEIPQWVIVNRYLFDGDSTGLEGHFDLADGDITGIRATATPSSEFQTELTALLWKCKPQQQVFDRSGSFEKDTEAYLTHLAFSLKVPVAITSNGLTAKDKQQRIRF